jgi:hypothetical protein
MRWMWFVLAVAATGCGPPAAEEPPALRLDDDGELFVAGVVSRLARDRYDLLELMVAPEASESLSNGRLAAMWQDLVDVVGTPKTKPRMLKVGTTPITRDDGEIGFFGQATFECANGVGRVRMEISCGSSGPKGGSCHPPYRIEELLLDAASVR